MALNARRRVADKEVSFVGIESKQQRYVSLTRRSNQKRWIVGQDPSIDNRVEVRASAQRRARRNSSNDFLSHEPAHLPDICRLRFPLQLRGGQQGQRIPQMTNRPKAQRKALENR